MAKDEGEKNKVLKEEIWEKIKEQVTGLKYGNVNIIIHDGRITQVETSSKIRF
ncbi:MAG: YezD family protein [Butyrivibrio sp.]|nr:YezD family protein [Butyrivibrio sp.]